jgi:signal transduction histidine kinase
LGFGILIVLIGALGVGAIQRANSIYEEMATAQDAYVRNEAFRRGIATDTYLADILVRDYLLDPSPGSAEAHRAELLAIRNSLQERLDVFSASMGETVTPDLKNLQDEVANYWESLDPVFQWTPKEKAERTWVFLARKVLPRREAVAALAKEMARLNNENLEKERERIGNTQQVLHTFLLHMTVSTLILGTLVAFLTTHRVVALERRHEVQRKEIEETQNNLRRLSNRLLEVQENERRNLSRELHDEVGQTMTALGIELGNLEDIRAGNIEAFRTQLEELKRLNADAMRTIRDLAMGLRPSMLDDLGLAAALEWQGREFSRHTGVPAEVRVDGNLDGLSEAQCTCIYRVVQEALTNCARHANARHVWVSICSGDAGSDVVVQDDGFGFDPAATARRGLGLLGIRERVQVLGGSVGIISEPMKGTTIRVHLPVATEP